MTTPIIFTKPGMGIDEGTLVKWHKAEGERVEAGEIVAEIETAKSVLEIEAPESGTLTHILVPEGSEIEVNAELAAIEN